MSLKMGWGKLYNFFKKGVNSMKPNEKKILVKKLYIEGLTYKEIARRVTLEYQKNGIDKIVKEEAIKKYIQRIYLSEKLFKYKEERKLNSIKLKDVKKVLQYESKRYICDNQLIKCNLNAYKISNGRTTLKTEKEMKCCLPSSMPRHFKVY